MPRLLLPPAPPLPTSCCTPHIRHHHWRWHSRPPGASLSNSSYSVEEAMAAAAAGAAGLVPGIGETAAAAGSSASGSEEMFTGSQWEKHCGAARSKAWQCSTKLVVAVAGGVYQLPQYR
ncbi:hypothetical protein HXX76_010986 [Chlamydomonas incerta]|uniref:Uncharacterized protein n=1 Tax=Chlamydomonas incerta TaxID=51695 RepID=A0A835T0C9_CHLIN|nr:hypothetical protein HXX76_010986 [Chlamydomonas incerta]|eukprot:KAG2429216.1 hypothetical protein HXX76_010986 [Chlamydomonas incerta]